jgi:hypothetical protein
MTESEVFQMKTTCGALRVLPWFMALLLGMVLAACGGGGGDSSSSTNPPPASATLLAVAVTPAVVSIPTSAVQAFRATATYSDGTTQDVTTSAIWTSGTTAVANVVQASGVTTSMASGSTTISAGFSGKTGSATLTVTSAVFI